MMCSKGDADLVRSGGSSRVIEVPHVEDCLQPVVNIVPLQVHYCFGLIASIGQILPAAANLAVPKFSDRLTNLLFRCSYWHTISLISEVLTLISLEILRRV